MRLKAREEEKDKRDTTVSHTLQTILPHLKCNLLGCKGL